MVQSFTFFVRIYKNSIFYPWFLFSKWTQVWQNHITYTTSSTWQSTESHSISSPVNNLILREEKVLSGQCSNKLIWWTESTYCISKIYSVFFLPFKSINLLSPYLFSKNIVTPQCFFHYKIVSLLRLKQQTMALTG